MDHETPSDEVLDQIGAIAMHRHMTAAESGHGQASREALQKLEELLAAEREALQSQGPGGGHAANIAALVREIEKLKSSAPPAAGARAGNRNPRHAQRPKSFQGAGRNFARNQGRGGKRRRER